MSMTAEALKDVIDALRKANTKNDLRLANLEHALSDESTRGEARDKALAAVQSQMEILAEVLGVRMKLVREISEEDRHEMAKPDGYITPLADD